MKALAGDRLDIFELFLSKGDNRKMSQLNLVQGLYAAIFINNMEVISGVLPKVVAQSQLDEPIGDEKRSLLDEAVFSNHMEIVVQLLESGSDVNFQDVNGATPLILPVCLSGSDSCEEKCNGALVTTLYLVPNILTWKFVT